MHAIARFVWVAAVLAPVQGYAHPQLAHAVPPVGSIVSPPSAVSLVFTEGVEPQFSSVVVTSGTGERVDKNDLAAPGGGTTLGVSLTKLAPGIYTVTWRVTGTDTHKARGMYRFQVAP
jgi:methionine-rich copper-binding protein CopC